MEGAVPGAAIEGARHLGHNWPVTLATSVSVHPLSPTIGAEISGVDIARPLAPEVVAAVRDALNTHHVIFFRDQSSRPSSRPTSPASSAP